MLNFCAAVDIKIVTTSTCEYRETMSVAAFVTNTVKFTAAVESTNPRTGTRDGNDLSS